METAELLSTVLRLSSQVLGCPVTPDQSFFAVGGDSVLALDLLIALEAELGVDIDERALFDTESFRELVGRIQEDSPEREAPAGRAEQ